MTDDQPYRCPTRDRCVRSEDDHADGDHKDREGRRTPVEDWERPYLDH